MADIKMYLYDIFITKHNIRAAPSPGRPQSLEYSIRLNNGTTQPELWK